MRLSFPICQIKIGIPKDKKLLSETSQQRSKILGINNPAAELTGYGRKQKPTVFDLSLNCACSRATGNQVEPKNVE